MTLTWRDTSHISQKGGILFPEYRCPLPNTNNGEIIIHRHINYGDEFLLTIHTVYISSAISVSLNKVRLRTNDPDKAKNAAAIFIAESIIAATGPLDKIASALQEYQADGEHVNE